MWIFQRTGGVVGHDTRFNGLKGVVVAENMMGENLDPSW